MSERKNLRAGLLGLIMVLAIGGLTILANRNAPTPAPATPAAAQQPASVGLQSLADGLADTPGAPCDDCNTCHKRWFLLANRMIPHPHRS